MLWWALWCIEEVSFHLKQAPHLHPAAGKMPLIWLVPWPLRGVIKIVPSLSGFCKLPPRFICLSHLAIQSTMDYAFWVLIPESSKLEALLIYTTASSEHKGSLVLEKEFCSGIVCGYQGWVGSLTSLPSTAHLTAVQRGGAFFSSFFLYWGF